MATLAALRGTAAAIAEGHAHTMTAPHAIIADHVFDGTILHHGVAVVLDGARIAAIEPRGSLPDTMPSRILPPGAWLAPGFIDIQVNGGGDVLFNDQPTPQGIATISRAHRRFGTTSLLLTLITDTDETMRAAANAVQTAMGSNPSVLGLHCEGPFLSPGKPGVHRRDLIRTPEPHHRELLTAWRGGATLVTLAPEQVPSDFISELVDRGVKVSLGHSMASYAQTRAAMKAGLSGFTHLFNAMPQLASREPGPIGAALENPDAYYGLIADGLHVAPATLRLALRGAGHPMLVTDAMPPVGGARGSFNLQGREITVYDGRCTTADGTLGGTLLDMASAVRNCVTLLGARLEDALRFASTEPANFLRLGGRLGRIARGFRADLVAFDPADIAVIATWVAGQSSD